MLYKTPGWMFAVLAIIGIGALVLAGQPDRNERSVIPPRFEAAQKKSLINRDMALTDRLCRLQCHSHLRQALALLNSPTGANASVQLEDIRKKHPNIVSLVWVDRQGIRHISGAVLPAIRHKLAPFVKQAEHAVSRSDRYESPRIRVNGEYYFVSTVPDDSGGGVTAIFRQTILNAVSDHQRKNLRLVPYPAEGNYKIESVDSGTHRDIHVDHGEENGGASHYHKHEVVVKFNSPLSDRQLQALRLDLQAKSIRKSGYTYVIQSTSNTAERMIGLLRKRTDVVYAEPHYLYMTNNLPSESDSAPNDDLFDPYQWNLPITQTIQGWDISKGSDEVIVAVLDTGVDLEHPDLLGRMTNGINIVNPDKEPMDDVGHGTHVAGVISASVNNMEGVAGMTWFDKIMPVKVLDETGAGSTYSVAEGIIWAADHGAKVINMSLGNYAQAEFLHDAIRYAFDRDVVLIAATGNDNTETPGFPAAYPEVFAVSAMDEFRQRAAFSNYGDYVDVVAPGVSIASTYPDNQYAALSGTSMASPHVSALAALIRSVNPALRNTEVMDVMRKTAIDLGPKGRDAQFGYGQIDVAAALAEAQRIMRSDNLFPEWIKRDIERIRAKFVIQG